MSKFIHGIRFKIVLLMMTLTLIPTLIITGWLYKSATDTMVEEIQYNQRISLENVTSYVEKMLKDIEVIESNILTDKELLKLVTEEANKKRPYEDYLDCTEIKKKLDKLKDVNEGIDSIYLYDEISDRTFSTDYYGYINMESTDNRQVGKILELAHSKKQWNVVKGDSTKKVFLSSRQHQIQKGKECFSFFINVNQKKINDLLEGLKGNPESVYYIMDKEGGEIAFTENLPEDNIGRPLDIEKNLEKVQFGGKDYYTAIKELKSVEWQCISLVPTHVVLGKLEGIRQTTGMIYLVSLVLILFFGMYMNQLIYEPIKNLITVIKKNKKGILTTSEIAEQRDEFGEIAKNFNELILTQDKLNRELRQQELLQKNSEIRFLQTQINPHFLYNILDTIHWLAGMGKNKEVMDMTFALSRFYRSSLSHGEDMTTVKEALQLTETYFEIQKIRFRNWIELIIDIEESLENVMVPKRLFQPLVENAINHGMVNMKQRGIVLITGVLIGDKIQFTVEDNGRGISEQKIAEINREICEGDFDAKGNYALKNLNRQLQLLYGNGCGLNLSSVPGRGTTVTVMISKERKERK